MGNPLRDNLSLLRHSKTLIAQPMNKNTGAFCSVENVPSLSLFLSRYLFFSHSLEFFRNDFPCSFSLSLSLPCLMNRSHVLRDVRELNITNYI